MIKIRSNVFETNSSSTHSISIDYNYKEKVFKHDKIPNNETIIIANDDVNFQFHSNGNNTTEWTKLNAIVNYILGHYWALGYFYFNEVLRIKNNYFFQLFYMSMENFLILMFLLIVFYDC